MTGGRKGKGKEVVGNSRHSEFVPPAIHQIIHVQSSLGSPRTHNHGDVPLLADNTPSHASHIPSSRASDAGASSNVPESPASLGAHPLSDRTANIAPKIFIWPRTKTKFDKQLQCVQKIGELIEMRFEGAWKSWRKFPKDTKDLIFSEWMRRSSSSPMEWESERTQLLNHINEIQSSFEARVEAAVEERVTNMEARFMARFASFEKDMRGLSVSSQLPKSPSAYH